MDQSYSESDVSLSPSQILERLQVLRQLQLLQRGKLQKHRLQYQESSETSSSITEIVSQFSNSTSYNSFRSLLQNSHETNEVTPSPNTSNITSKVKEQDLVDGISVLNLSRESEFVVNSPVSSKSQVSVSSRNETGDRNSSLTRNVASKALSQKHIALDEMPILSPKQDFEALVLEKLKNEKIGKNKSPQKDNLLQGGNKKPFLKRGEGMARYGLRRNDLVIQNTQALPWKRKTITNSIESPLQKNLPKNIKSQENVGLQIFMTDSKASSSKNSLPIDSVSVKISDTKETWKTIEQQGEDSGDMIVDSRNCEIHCSNNPISKIQPQKGKQSLHATSNKDKTWAAVLTKEQNDFLRQLKQSEYYKNFASPAKSTVSDMSCDENLNKLRQEREIAEQNVFELLETKVTNESFSIENSFINKFLKRNKLECSGESTPLIMQKCLTNNPELMHIFPDIIHKRRNDQSLSEVETCNSEYTDCCSDNCSVSSCCSCKTVETVENSSRNRVRGKETKKRDPSPQRDQAKKKTKENNITDNECKDATVTENDIMKANMAEMNAKLFATGEHLKDKLNELEDEIQTFKKENTNLAKLREEIDLERQKFYEEKNSFEQKFNEEKILSEYYLAEEKEKLSKQKQTYERYVREMRGRLNKKEKDEVVNLKKEISDLKEEIRLKDAKTTSTIARLRNQIKNMEKERKDLQDEVEKLKKENRRIQHSNDITRRLSNMKYLEEINKKLTHMSSKDVRSEVNLDNDAKYKSYEIERQSRSKRVQSIPKGTIRPRAKSVPNLKVTSRYAKYFSQRDAVSQMDRELLNVEPLNMYSSDNEDTNDNDNVLNDAESIQDNNSSDSEPENHLEKVYMERFQSGSTVTNRSSSNNPNPEIWHSINENPDRFFIRKSNSGSNRDSNSSNNTISPLLRSSSISNTSRSKSPLSVLSNRSVGRTSPANTVQDARDANSQRSKSPISILTNHSSGNRLATVVNQDQYRDKLMTLSPEPSTSKTSLTKTSLNPTEIKKPDGSKELRFPNGNIKYLSSDGKYSKFVYYNGDVKENFFDEGRIKYFYAEANTYHTTHADGLEVLEFPDGQVEKRYKDGSSEIRLPNGSIRYFDPKNEHVREEWRFPDGTALTVSSDGEQRIVFSNGQIEIHAKDHKRREFPDGTVKLVYNDGTAETRYASGRVRIKDKHGNLIMDSAPG